MSTTRLLAALAAATLLPLAAPVLPTAVAGSSMVARIDFVEQTPGATITTPTVRGSGASGLAARVVSEGGGRAWTGDNSTSTTHRAMRLPAYAPLHRPSTPLAVLGIRNTTTTDALEVGDRSFRWQADFRQDTELGDVEDDGDNVFQRGLASGASQWKLSADGHKVGCYLRIGGRWVGTWTATVRDTAWYRASCTRTVVSATRATLTLDLRRWDGTRYVPYRSHVADGNAAGRISFPRSVPASVGGKLNDDGTLHSNPDQFNGTIDNPVLDVW
ncbi:hypothetical protein [Phycicoccus flavus]|uniref:Uncharacterized protein n=1 Tax=Phycicoccus flavus TaxID=2502783 RepID=A0A8T6R4Y9_9MICO|nr:hypothetical protein [Phycicoccus flavus]NHA69037.1 hypothetical protein [Phycicoccus flavus]